MSCVSLLLKSLFLQLVCLAQLVLLVFLEWPCAVKAIKSLLTQRRTIQSRMAKPYFNQSLDNLSLPLVVIKLPIVLNFRFMLETSMLFRRTALLSRPGRRLRRTSPVLMFSMRERCRRWLRR